MICLFITCTLKRVPLSICRHVAYKYPLKARIPSVTCTITSNATIVPQHSLTCVCLLNNENQFIEGLILKDLSKLSSIIN